MDRWSGMDNSNPSIYSARQKGHVSMPMTSKEPEEATPANHIPGPKQGEWTYSHYAALPDDGNRYEIIDGVLYMAPSPDTFHQDITGWIYYYLKNHVISHSLGKVFAAPYDVKLALSSVVQPDIVVILKEHKERVKEKCIAGAPDLVVEVASRSTKHLDRKQKYNSYACAGVSEYWIVDPQKRNVEVFVLEGGDYRLAGIFSGEEILHSKVLPKFLIQAKLFFQEDWP
jgi:Uma2 family endonuclease